MMQDSHLAFCSSLLPSWYLLTWSVDVDDVADFVDVVVSLVLIIGASFEILVGVEDHRQFLVEFVVVSPLSLAVVELLPHTPKFAAFF